MISPIENNGMIARVQDYTAMRQQEDIKLNAAQVHIQQEIDEHGENHVRTVHDSDNSDAADTHHDAREEGRNKYFSNRGDKKDSKAPTDGKVVVKNKGGFDLKI